MASPYSTTMNDFQCYLTVMKYNIIITAQTYLLFNLEMKSILTVLRQ